jgi:hypothetical protein
VIGRRPAIAYKINWKLFEQPVGLLVARQVDFCQLDSRIPARCGLSG